MSRNEKLTYPQQIEDMRCRGIKFELYSEADAIKYLRNSTYYFRIKSYAKNFDQYQNGPKSGQYLHLDFAYLVELSVLDMRLRNHLFLMCQDVEHYAKNMLIRDITINQFEDGISIINKTFSKESLDAILEEKKSAGFCKNLVESRSNGWAVWSLVEVLSFSGTLKLYKAFYDMHPECNSYYTQLFCVKHLRNACAHNNCLLNSIKRTYDFPKDSSSTAHLEVINRLHESGFCTPSRDAEKLRSTGENPITSSTLKKRMRNRVINDIVVLLWVYNKIVTSTQLRKHRMDELQDFINNRMLDKSSYFTGCNELKEAYNLIKKLVDFLCETSI